MQHKLDVFSTALSFQEEDVREKTIVVIDVLRATSTIVTGLNNGARAIIPVLDMAEAGKIAGNLDSSQYLLCGERDGEKIEGYHLGNSPFEYTPEVVKNKTLILNTTNGTKAITKASQADILIISSFLNVGRVVEELKETENEIILVCAGWKNRFSLEDMLCAGNIIFELMDGNLVPDARDGAKMAFTLYEKFRSDIEGVVRGSNHAVRLRNLVDESDIIYCCQVNSIPILPVFDDGVISLKNG